MQAAAQHPTRPAICPDMEVKAPTVRMPPHRMAIFGAQRLNRLSSQLARHVPTTPVNSAEPEGFGTIPNTVPNMDNGLG